MRGAVEYFRVLCSLDLPGDIILAAAPAALRKVIPALHGQLAVVTTSGKFLFGFSDDPVAYSTGFPSWSEQDEPPAFPGVLKNALTRPRSGIFLELQHQLRRRTGNQQSTHFLLDGMIALSQDRVLIVNMLRSQDDKPFDGDNLRRLNQALPWLAQAIDLDPKEPSPAAGPVWLEASAVVDLTHLTIIQRSRGFDQLNLHMSGQSAVWPKLQPSDPDTGLVSAGLRKLLPNLRPGQQESISISVQTPIGTMTAAVQVLSNSHSQSPGPQAAIRLALHHDPAVFALGRFQTWGCTPAQAAVGVRLAFGRSKRSIAGDLAVSVAAVEDASRKLYARLELHSAAELAARLWLP